MVMCARTAKCVQEGQEKAARTSGQRGVAARKEVNRLEAALAACAITPDEDVDYSIQKVLEGLLPNMFASIALPRHSSDVFPRF